MRFSSDSIDTLAAHAGRDGFAALGVHAPPIDLSSTYPFPDLDQATGALDAFAAGAATAATPIYGRLHNPTVARCEEALAALEAAEQAVAFGSGMPASSASAAVLTRLPLCARANCTWLASRNNGWEFFHMLEPVVE